MEKNKLEVELLLDRVIIEGIKKEDEQRASGFTVPAKAREQNQNLPKYGYIVAVGPGDPAKGKMSVRVGDLVMYQFYSGVPLTMNNTDYLVMREGDICFIMPNKNRETNG